MGIRVNRSASDDQATLGMGRFGLLVIIVESMNQYHVCDRKFGNICQNVDSAVSYPGLFGEAFGCGFLQSAKGYSSENSLSGKGEHYVDSQAVF